MEPDSTTYEKNPKALRDEPNLPFNTCPGNLKLYKEFIADNGDKSLESQIVERMQNFGLLPKWMKCPTNELDCKVICRPARVVDRVQWICDGCGKRQPIRDGSFFFRLQCSIVQALQIILAWCQDADCNIVAEIFGVKAKVANHIYEKLDDLAIKEYKKHKLGGEDSVVLTELYPDCLNRLSPDTTDQPHVHRIVMVADTNHIPTYYRMNVIREDPRNMNAEMEKLKVQIDEFISESVEPESLLVRGHNMPPIEDSSSIQQLTRHCDVEMEHFLSNGVWRQAILLCSASRDMCGRAALPAHCAIQVERYLQASLYRIRFGDGFYKHILDKIAEEYTRPQVET